MKKERISLSIAYCHKDIDQIIRLLRWIKLLGPKASCDHDKKRVSIILSGAAALPYEVHEIVLTEARQAGFDAIQAIAPSVDERGWPGSCSGLLVNALNASKRSGFDASLFIEPDAFPLRSDWLYELFSEYYLHDMPFMGARVVTGPTLVNPAKEGLRYEPYHMSGVAFYPANYATLSPLIVRSQYDLDTRFFGRRGIPWDIYAAPEILPNMQESRLIYHAWGEKSNPAADIDANKQIALYHQCKTAEGIKAADRIIHNSSLIGDKDDIVDMERDVLRHIRTRRFVTNNANRPATINIRGKKVEVEWTKNKFLAGNWSGRIEAKDIHTIVAMTAEGYSYQVL